MIDNFPSSPFYSIERMAEERQLQLEQPMRWIELVYPRVIGFIVFAGSLNTMHMAWTRRSFLFHRLVFGMAAHLSLYGLCNLVGTLAIPSDNDDHIGNVGTTATCTTQGFVIYVTRASAIFYYAFLSVFSYLGVLNSFNKAKYMWCQHWIHFLVHLYPVSTGIYWLVLEGFNPSYGFCYKASDPLFCEYVDMDDMTCERGIEKHETKHLIMIMIPALFVVLFPTCVMIALYLTVRKREKEQQQAEGNTFVLNSNDIFRQSGLYLITLYVPVLPMVILAICRETMKKRDLTLFKFGYLAMNTVFALFGLTTMVVYRHFSLNQKKKKNAKIFNFRLSTMHLTNLPPPAETTDGSESDRGYSFNIFDGTNATGAFADFIHDGDSDDERADNAQTTHWSSVQDQI